MFSHKMMPWSKYGCIQVASHHQTCCRTKYYRSMIYIPNAHGQNKVCILNESVIIKQREHTQSGDHLYVDDGCTGSGPSYPAPTLYDVLLWITNINLCQFTIIKRRVHQVDSSKTPSHNKATINQSTGSSGERIENIGFTHQRSSEETKKTS